MVAAGFTGGEAGELRRATGFKRSSLGERTGMIRHHAALLAGLLNAWPMGFYNPATFVAGRLCRS